jgi:purine-binding chemotaxis protein CheW
LDHNDDTLKGKYLIFSIGPEQYGIEIRYITEIISMQSITQVPDMPRYIKGITNLRGKIIPVMDARMRFGKELRIYEKQKI